MTSVLLLSQEVNREAEVLPQQEIEVQEVLGVQEVEVLEIMPQEQRTNKQVEIVVAVGKLLFLFMMLRKSCKLSEFELRRAW